MIRGVLILLLSFVALSLQQTCTCQKDQTPFAGSGAAFPIDFGAYGAVSLAATPDQLSVVSQWAGQFTTMPTLAQLQTYFATQLTTVDAQQKVNDAMAENATAHQKVANLTQMQEDFNNQKAIIQAKFDAFWAWLDQQVDNKDDPKACCIFLIDLWNIQARGRYIERLNTWITVHLKAATDFAALTSQRVSTLEGQLQISQNIDNQMVICSCDRTTATAAVLVTFPPEFAASFTAFGTALSTFSTNLQASITASSADFTDQTAQDTTDAADAVTVYGVWAKYENRIHATYDDIVTWIKGLIAAVDKKAAFVARIIACLKSDFTVTNPSWSCTGQDTDTTTCDLTGTIACTGDCSTGVDNLVSFSKVVFVGFTGCVWADVSKTYDPTTGAFDVTITVSRAKMTVLLDTYADATVQANTDITTIVVTAKSEADTYNAAATDVTTDVQTAIDAQTTAANDAATATAAASVTVAAAIQARSDGWTAYASAQVTAQGQLASATVEKKYKIAFDCWNASISKGRDDKSCASSAFAKSLSQAEVDLALAAGNFYSCKLDALNDPNNDAGKNQYFIDAKASLEQKVEDCCVTRDQIKAAKDAVDTVVTAIDAKKAQWEASLTTKINNLDAGVEATTAQIQADWKANQDDTTSHIKAAITGAWDTVRQVTCTYTNLDGSAGAYVQVSVTIDDEGVAGETVDQCKARQQAILEAAIAMTSQCTSFKVEFTSSASVSTTKRQTSSSNTYTATQGNAPPAPTPNAPTSSAGTLAVSVIVAFVACLVRLF
jgi:hypothetical protein